MQKKIYIISCLAILSVVLTSCQKKPSFNQAYALYEQSTFEAEHGNIERAIDLINQAIVLESEARFHAFKATLLYQSGKTQESLALFEKIINNKKTPSFTKHDALNNYACAMRSTGNTSRAVLIWRQLVSNKDYLTPEVALFNLGLVEFEAARRLEVGTDVESVRKNPSYIGFLKNAIAQFNSAIKHAPQYTDALVYKGVSCLKLDMLTDAQQALEAAVMTSPDHHIARSLLASLNSTLAQKPLPTYVSTSST